MGMLITLFLIPVGWAGAFGGFLLFRVSDVVKPYPANRLERCTAASASWRTTAWRRSTRTWRCAR